MPLFDTHCHLASDAYAADLDQVVDRAWAAGLAGVVVPAELSEDAPRALELAARTLCVRVAVGVHPHNASRWVDAVPAELAALAADPRVVAIGETGLDYHYDHSPRAAQHAAFHAQLELAARLGKPAVVHAREADEDITAILREHPRTRVILHSFSSGRGLLDAALALGHYVSFSGMVTFRNWAADDAVREVPSDRLLLETDGPYLAPVPLRGQRNEPAFVVHVAARLAAVRGADPITIADQTSANARAVFGL